MFSSLALLGFVGNATANDIHFCDSCTQAQRGVLATQLTSGLGQVYIGDRTTGVPYLYTVTTVNGPVSVAPPGIQEQPVSQADADQFTIYSSVYRSYENSGTLNVKIDLANGPVAPSSVSRMVEVASDESSAFASAFDVRREGATRQHVIQWLEKKTGKYPILARISSFSSNRFSPTPINGGVRRTTASASIPRSTTRAERSSPMLPQSAPLFTLKPTIRQVISLGRPAVSRSMSITAPTKARVQHLGSTTSAA